MGCATCGELAASSSASRTGESSRRLRQRGAVWLAPSRALTARPVGRRASRVHSSGASARVSGGCVGTNALVFMDRLEWAAIEVSSRSTDRCLPLMKEDRAVQRHRYETLPGSVRRPPALVSERAALQRCPS